MRLISLMSLSALLQITQELRDYAQQHQIDEELAAQVGMLCIRRSASWKNHCLIVSSRHLHLCEMSAYDVAQHPP